MIALCSGRMSRLHPVVDSQLADLQDDYDRTTENIEVRKGRLELLRSRRHELAEAIGPLERGQRPELSGGRISMASAHPDVMRYSRPRER